VTRADASEPEAAPVAVRLHHVSKSFPGVQALRDICFDLLAGEVHGLVGANGACKCAMIRMLSGASTPDSGEIEVGGAPLLNDDPRHLRAAGISAIYQELTIIPEMTALSNAFLGAAPSRWGFTDLGRMRALRRIVLVDGRRHRSGRKGRRAADRESANAGDHARRSCRRQRADHG
jgi:ribose transport system ATP-binding protein